MTAIKTDDEFLICEHCLAENELQDEIRKRGVPIEECLICHAKGGRALPARDPLVTRIFRALIRLNYSEWHYNTHVGGDGLEDLIFRDKKIFNLPEGASQLDFDDAFLVMEAIGWYPKNEEDISLGGNYSEGWVLDGLRDVMDSSIDGIVRRAFKENFHHLLLDVRKIIDRIRLDIEREVEAGRAYFRARVGITERLRKTWGGGEIPTKPQYGYLPFTGKDIDRPPIKVATEGRLNRVRVSVLYMATDVETAVAELRPHPGQLVSTAKFVSLRPIKIADFAAQDIRDYLSDSRLEDLRAALSISSILDLPIQPEQRHLYLLTQLFSDCLRETGFEGVAFRSSVGPGVNVVCFAEDAFQEEPGSGSVMEVRSLQYELVGRESLPQDFDRTDYESDSDDPLSSLADGLARRA